MTTAAHPDLTATGIAQFLGALRSRWLRVRAFECVLWGVCSGALAALVLQLATDFPPSALWATAILAALAGLAIAAILTALRLPGQHEIAQLADRRLALQEKLSSTLELYRFDTARGLVASALLATTDAAIAQIDPRRFEAYFSARRIALSVAALLLVAAASAAFLWAPAPSSRTAGTLTASEISEIAQALAEDAALRQDEEMTAIAEELEDLAAQAEEAPPQELARDLEDLFTRAGSRFGQNPAHNWPPFQGENSGLAARIEEFRENLAMNGPASNPSAGASETATGADIPTDDIRASSLPPMDESMSLGLAPPEGQTEGGGLEDDGTSHDLEMPPTQMSGEAEGAGTGLSNFAGAGELPEELAPMTDAGPPAGFGEVRELSSAQPEDGATTRIGMETDERATAVEDGVTSRAWPHLDSVPVDRVPVPSAAAGAVERYFARNKDQEQ